MSKQKQYNIKESGKPYKTNATINQKDYKKLSDKKQQKRLQYKLKMQQKERIIKIPICKYFLYGACKLDDCIYSHDVSPDQMKKFNEMCKYYPKGECSKGAMCCYMHEKFPCQFFHSTLGNVCSKGNNCLFSHDPLTKEMEEILENHLKLQAPRDQFTEATITETNEHIQSNFGKSSFTSNILESVNIQNFGQSLFTSSNLYNKCADISEDMVDGNENTKEKEMCPSNNEEINVEIRKENMYQNKENIKMTKLSSFSSLFALNSLLVNNETDDIDSLNDMSNLNIDRELVDNCLTNLPKINEPVNILESLASNMNNIPTFKKIIDSDSDCDEEICENYGLNKSNSSFKANEYTKTVDSFVDKIVNKDAISTENITVESSISGKIVNNNNKFDVNFSQLNSFTLNTQQNHTFAFNESVENSNYSENFLQRNMLEKENDALKIIDLNKSRTTEPLVENKVFKSSYSNQRNIENIDKMAENVDQNLLGKRLLENTEKVQCKKRKMDELKLPILTSLIELNKCKTLESNDKEKKSKPIERISKKTSKPGRPLKKKLLKSKPKLTPSIINSDLESDINRNDLESLSNDICEPSFPSNNCKEIQIENVQEQIEEFKLKSEKDCEINSTNTDKNCSVTNLLEIDDTDNNDWLIMGINADIKMIPVFIDLDDEDADNMNNVGKISNENKFQIEKNSQENESKTEIIEIENFVGSSQNIPVNINNQENQNSLAMSSKADWSIPILNLPSQIKYHEMNINCYNLYHKFDDPRIRNHPRALKQSVYEWLIS